MAADAKGDVYLSDSLAATIYRVGGDGKAAVFLRQTGGSIAGEAFGPDGTLYGVVPSEKKIVAVSPQGHSRTVAEGIAARGIVVTHDGTIYVSEPGAHSDMPSRVWQIGRGGKKECRSGTCLCLRSCPFAGRLSVLCCRECY